MTAKQYLRSIRSEQKELKTMIEHRETIYFSLLPSAIRYDKDRVQTSPDDQMMDKVIKTTELDAEIDEYIAMLRKHKADALKIIRQINNSLYRQVLIDYYLVTKENGKPMRWDDVAGEIFRGERQTKRIHGKALIEFQKKFDKFQKSC